jgi:outer membrane protein assembly factor BamB
VSRAVTRAMAQLVQRGLEHRFGLRDRGMTWRIQRVSRDIAFLARSTYRRSAGFLSLTTACCCLADQPQLGEQHSRNMVSSTTELPAQFDPRTGLNVRWVAELGTSTYSTPAIAGGRVFIGTNNGNPRNLAQRGDRGVLFCLDEADGRLHWQLLVPKIPHDPYQDCPGVGITSTAAIEGERAYLVSNRGEVISLDIHGMANGNTGPFRDERRFLAWRGSDPVPINDTDADIVWYYDMREGVGIRTHDSANVSVLLHGDFLYTSTPNGVDYTHRHIPSPDAPGLIVLDRHTGRLLARDHTGVGARIFHSTFSSPALGAVAGRDLVFYGGADGVVYAFEALRETPPAGTVKPMHLVWRFDCDPSAPKEDIEQYQGNREISPSSIIAPPVFHQGRVYVVAGGDPWHGKRQAWIQCIDPSGTGDITSTGMIWSHPLFPHSTSTPAIHNGLVFITDFSGTIHCLDAETGELHWTQATDDEIWSSPLVADGKLYVATRGGQVWVFDADSALRLLHTASFDRPITASPVAANGTLYVTTSNRLYAFATSR